MGTRGQRWRAACIGAACIGAITGPAGSTITRGLDGASVFQFADGLSLDHLSIEAVPVPAGTPET